MIFLWRWLLLVQWVQLNSGKHLKNNLQSLKREMKIKWQDVSKPFSNLCKYSNCCNIREWLRAPIDSIQGSSRIFFSHLRPSRRKFLFKILFSYFFSKISSLNLAKPRKYSLLQFWRYHLGCSLIIFFFFLFFVIRLNYYEAYLRNGAT